MDVIAGGTSHNQYGAIGGHFGLLLQIDTLNLVVVALNNALEAAEALGLRSIVQPRLAVAGDNADFPLSTLEGTDESTGDAFFIERFRILAPGSHFDDSLALARDIGRAHHGRVLQDVDVLNVELRRQKGVAIQQILGGLGQLQLQLALGHRLADAQQQQLDDLLDLLLLQLVEDDHVVDAVEELGPEDLLQLTHDAVLHVVVGDPGLVV